MLGEDTDRYRPILEHALKLEKLTRADNEDSWSFDLKLPIQVQPVQVSGSLVAIQVKHGEELGWLYNKVFAFLFNGTAMVYRMELQDLVHKLCKDKEFCEEPEACKLQQIGEEIVAWIPGESLAQIKYLQL